MPPLAAYTPPAQPVDQVTPPIPAPVPSPRSESSGDGQSSSKGRPKIITQMAAPSAVPGLVAAYSFDEAEGPRVGDASGNGNAGYIGNASWSEGRFGSALQFSGKDAMTIRASQPLDATGEITLQAWINPSQPQTDWRDVITRENSNGAGAFSLPAASADGVPGEGWVVKEKFKLVPGRWSHLATTFDGRVQRLYFNGKLVAVRPHASKKIESGALYIGGSPTWGNRFKGKIDEVRIYNRALTGEEIRTDMNRPVFASR